MGSSSSSSSTTSRPRLLLVEDDRATYTALRGILNLRGWEVVVATSIAEAKPILDERLDAVILDLMLPDGNGEALLTYLRAIPSTIPVAVTTGVNDDQRIAVVERLGPTVLLRKPIVLADLLRAIAPAAA